MVTIPEFVELISQKIDIQTDVNSLRKKQTAIRNEITKYNGNLLQTEKRLTELDIADRHYQNKVDSLNRILDDLYEKIEDAQTRLDEVNQEITMVEKSAMTKKSIFEMLEGFSKYYDVMSPEDKKALLQAMVSFIHNYIDTDAMILRKGAVSARMGEKLLIPINMRDGSLICIGKGNAEWNCSAPHGAGRLMSRRTAFNALSMEEFQKEVEGVYTTCVLPETLDEFPMAYKSMDEIVSQIEPTAEIIQRIRPVYNFKAAD